MKILKLILIVFVMLCFSCRKDINVKLPEYRQKLVVEASIETGSPGTVLLSYSVPFFGTFDFTKPENAFVKGAFVTISDGAIIDTLKEADPTQGYLYVGTKVLGQVGKSYFLTIHLNNKTYSAITSINTPVQLDSIYFKGEQDSLGLIWAHMHEPSGYGNYYRWFAKRLNKDMFYAAPFNSVFEDKFIDGKDFEFAYDRGSQPNETQADNNDEEQGFYKVGDEVVVKFCTIGKREYEFWYSYYLNRASNGNPFASPSNIKSTIEGEDVLGGFFGYSTSFDTLVISK